MAKLNGTTITNACNMGASYFNSFSSPQEFYQNCNRGDWLLWLFVRTNPNSLKELTLAKAHCANTVRHLMGDERSQKAVDTAIRFGEGKASREELAATSDAAYAAADTADAAYDTADAAYAAAYAADAAADTAADAASARTQNRQLTADIIRKYLPLEIWDFDSIKA